jgi:hypothetical protein
LERRAVIDVELEDDPLRGLVEAWGGGRGIGREGERLEGRKCKGRQRRAAGDRKSLRPAGVLGEGKGGR